MMRAEIDTYLDIKTSLTLTASDPMDVDAMGKGKGKAKGKGAGGSQVGPCHVCGRLGHIAKECWHKNAQREQRSEQGWKR